MTPSDRQKLLRRIRQVRRSTAAREEREAGGASPEPTVIEEDADLLTLEQRIAHLEHLLEGFQDSVHREFERRDQLIEQLQREIQPAALGAALAEDARRRGL